MDTACFNENPTSLSNRSDFLRLQLYEKDAYPEEYEKKFNPVKFDEVDLVLL